MSSVRSRLALALALVLILPVVVSVVAVGVLAPAQTRVAARATMLQAAASTALSLVDQCLSLGESARGLALQAQSRDLDAAALAAVRRQPGAFAAVVRGGSVVASAGELPADPPVTRLLDTGCSRQRGAPTATRSIAGPPIVAEVVPATDALGASLGSVVVGRVIDTDTLVELLKTMSAQRGTGLALACPGGRGVTTLSDPAAAMALRRAAAEGVAPSSIAGWQVATARGSSGQVCAVAAGVRPPGTSLLQSGGVALVLFIGLALALALVLRLANGLTRPILALTEAAERVARGDLTSRLPDGGGSELGRLSGSFNHMTDELQAKIGELERSRDLLRENVGRLGDTLQRTHDLDGLLMTVLGAAASATTAHRATVWLVEGSTVVARISSPVGAPRAATRRLPLGADLAGEVAADGVPRRLGHGHGDSTTVLGGPALCAPLRRGHAVLGVIVVERQPQQPAFDADDEAMLVSLAGPAGIAVDNVMLHREAQRLSVTDPLTGAGNLRHMTTTLAREVERATRFQRPLSLLLLDLDHFKNVNDTYGHTVGDAVLREIARRLAGCVREVDIVARYGGEEFVVVTPETDITGAEHLAARICEAVREEPIVVGSDVVVVTVSVGIATLPMHGTVGGERLHLRHGVEGTSLVELDIDVAERLQSGTDTARRLAHPARDSANPAVRAGEESDDAIGLAQLLGAQHDGLVAVEGHATFSLPAGQRTASAHGEVLGRRNERVRGTAGRA